MVWAESVSAGFGKRQGLHDPGAMRNGWIRAEPEATSSVVSVKMASEFTDLGEVSVRRERGRWPRGDSGSTARMSALHAH